MAVDFGNGDGMEKFSPAEVTLNEAIETKVFELTQNRVEVEKVDRRKRNIRRLIQKLDCDNAAESFDQDPRYQINVTEEKRGDWIKVLRDLRYHIIVTCLQIADFDNNSRGLSKLSKATQLPAEFINVALEFLKSLGLVYIDDGGFIRSPSYETILRVYEWLQISETEMEQINASLAMRFNMEYRPTVKNKGENLSTYLNMNLVVASETDWNDFVAAIKKELDKLQAKNIDHSPNRKIFGFSMFLKPIVVDNLEVYHD